MNEKLSKGVLLCISTAILWGILPILQKIMLKHLDATTICWSRFLIAIIFSLVYFVWKDREQLRTIKKMPPLLVVLCGVGVGLDYMGGLKGLEYTSPNTVGIIVQIAPIIFGVIGVVFFKEKLNKIQLVGVILALIGLYVFYINQISHFSSNVSQFNIGFVFILIGALGWIIYAVTQKIIVRGHNPLAVNLVLYCITFLMFTPFVNYKSLLVLDFGQYMLLLVLGLNTLVAYGALAMAMKMIDAHKVSIIIIFNPIITILTMTILTLLNVSFIQGEIISLEASVGAVLLLIGAVIVNIYHK